MHPMPSTQLRERSPSRGQITTWPLIRCRETRSAIEIIWSS